jgi:hypothetical protein
VKLKLKIPSVFAKFTALKNQQTNISKLNAFRFETKQAKEASMAILQASPSQVGASISSQLKVELH